MARDRQVGVKAKDLQGFGYLNQLQPLLQRLHDNGIDKSGKMSANAREQIEIAFENVKAALTSVGANFGNIVKLNNYIVDIGTNIAHYREVRDKYVNTAAPPASTTIGVPQLARPGALFEIEAIAVLPPK